MPEDFERCVAEGGRVRTMSLSNDRYVRVCWDKSGEPHRGEVTKAATKEKPKE